ncbi:S-layer homology domain-containing protein [Lysinibacillus telephonicus]|uniref:S-layer homology domain-containing protein n=1 Tax=Lysinibacillus telephonicus TaxID=1714840 RepID=UPI00397C5A69
MKKKSKRFQYLTGLSAAAVVVSTVAPISTSAALFSDINGNSHQFAIEALVKQGIINGYADGTFKPGKGLTRSDVVKILGKYLVSIGYKIPNDYKSNMRYSDLSKNTSDELLQYAALVKDVGVFNGNNGQLLPNEEMLREHMAVVLVRAFSTIHNFDYIDYVANQNFNIEIRDLGEATNEAQRAIKVLDYFDITKASSFNPKSVTERGQFASMFYNMSNVRIPALTVKEVEVLSANELEVTLSDDTTHHVELKDSLEENVPTTVSFEIDNISYSAKVTYSISQLKVDDVKNNNGGQFTIYFNQEINLDSTTDSEKLESMFKLTGIDNAGSVSLNKGEISEDKRSYKITIDDEEALNKRYRLKINGVKSMKGYTLSNYEGTFFFNEDNVEPKINGIQKLSGDKVKVIFSEPIKSVSDTPQFKLAGGQTVSNITGKIERNATEVVFDLSNATSNGEELEGNTKIYVKFGVITDIAGNTSSPEQLEIELRKADEDGVKPVLESVTQLGAKQFKLTFSEDLSPIWKSDLQIIQGGSTVAVESVEQDKDDLASFIVIVGDYLQGNVTISTANGHTISDISGETATFKTTHTFTTDSTRSSVIDTQVVREENNEYLYITFDRNIMAEKDATVSIDGVYVHNGVTNQIPSTNKAIVRTDKTNKKVVRVLLRELLKDIDLEDAQYFVNLTFDGVTNERNMAVYNAEDVKFTRSVDYNINNSRLEVVTIETSRSSDDIEENNRLLINFNYPVNQADAENKNNYQLAGYRIESANYYASKPYQVELIVRGSSTSGKSPNLKIKNIRAEGSFEKMKEFNKLVDMYENRKPIFLNATVTNELEITLKFNEELADIEDNYFVIKDNEGNSFEVTSKLHPSDRKKIILTVSNDEDEDKAMRLTIKVKPNKEITDLSGNKTEWESTTIYVQSTFW